MAQTSQKFQRGGALQTVTSLADWKALRPSLPASLGLVPTMGAIHEGHLSLARRARAENEVAVVWIFVNPKQFGPQGDFDSYPRDLAADLSLLEAEGVDYVLAPPVEDVYPPGFQTYVEVEELSRPLEGQHRPGHFRGVATVVAKMFCLTQCRRAYFGQKDAQQTLVVARLARDQGMLTEIVVCPTVRQPDGLALSSRNVYLSPRERKAATILHRALKDCEVALNCGERDGEVLRRRMLDMLAREPLAQVEYVSIANPETLAEFGPGPNAITGPALASLAVNFGNTRLIDNLMLELR